MATSLEKLHRWLAAEPLAERLAALDIAPGILAALAPLIQRKVTDAIADLTEQQVDDSIAQLVAFIAAFHSDPPPGTFQDQPTAGELIRWHETRNATSEPDG